MLNFDKGWTCSFSLSLICNRKKETGISYCCWNNDVSLHSFFSSRVPLLSRSLFLLFFLFPFPGFCCVCFLHGRRSLKHLDFLFTRPSLKSRSSGTTTTRKKHDEIKKKRKKKMTNARHTHTQAGAGRGSGQRYILSGNSNNGDRWGRLYARSHFSFSLPAHNSTRPCKRTDMSWELNRRRINVR